MSIVQNHICVEVDNSKILFTSLYLFAFFHKNLEKEEEQDFVMSTSQVRHLRSIKSN